MKRIKLLVILDVEDDCDDDEIGFSDDIVEVLQHFEGVENGFALTMSEAAKFGFIKEVEEAA